MCYQWMNEVDSGILLLVVRNVLLMLDNILGWADGRDGPSGSSVRLVAAETYEDWSCYCADHSLHGRSRPACRSITLLFAFSNYMSHSLGQIIRSPVKSWWKCKPTWKLKHTNSILEYFEYFCQISSKSIIVISSYTGSKFMHFLRHSVCMCLSVRALTVAIFIRF